MQHAIEGIIMTNNEILSGLRNGNISNVLINEDAKRLELTEKDGTRVTHYAPADLDMSVALWFRSEFLLAAGKVRKFEIEIKENGAVSDYSDEIK